MCAGVVLGQLCLLSLLGTLALAFVMGSDCCWCLGMQLACVYHFIFVPRNFSSYRSGNLRMTQAVRVYPSHCQYSGRVRILTTPMSLA